jgi:ribonuclease HI
LVFEKRNEKMIIYTDGATIGHNGKLGTVKQVGLGIWIPELKMSISKKTTGLSNNEAEWKALILGMNIAINKCLKHVEFRLDSTIVVNKAKQNECSKKGNSRMLAFQREVILLKKQFTFFNIMWVPREENKQADLNSKRACKKKLLSRKFVSTEFVPERIEWLEIAKQATYVARNRHSVCETFNK